MGSTPTPATMENWHPKAKLVVADQYPEGAGAYRSGRWKFVVHTVEGVNVDRPLYSPRTSDYFGHQSWPHATIDVTGIYQHMPIGRMARTLKNAAGGVETNAAHAIQCELFWNTKDIASAPQALLDHLRDWLAWCSQQTGQELIFADFTGGRMDFAEWNSFAGVCGHKHVPENDHTDPGPLPIERLMTGDTFLMALSAAAQDALAIRVEEVWRNLGVLQDGVKASTAAVGQVAALRAEVQSIKGELAALRGEIAVSNLNGGVDAKVVADAVVAALVKRLA